MQQVWSGKVPGSAQVTIRPTASRAHAGARSRLRTAWAQLQCFLSNNLPWGDAATLRDARRRVSCNAMPSPACWCACQALSFLLLLTPVIAQNIVTAVTMVLPWLGCMLLVSSMQVSGVGFMLLLLCTQYHVTRHIPDKMQVSC